MEDDGDGRRDVGWKYAFLGDPNNKNDVTCKFCQKVAKGGIYRLKQHLAGGYRNIKACNKCPEHIRQEIIEYMAKKKSERDQMNLLHEPDKITDLEEEETEFFMANDPRGKRPMSAVVSQASVAKKARQVGPMDAFCTPKVVALQSGKQSTINEAYRKEQREKAAADVARWLYDAGIPFNALNYPSFKVAMDSVARAGIGQKPLSAYEARVPFLRKEVQRTNDLMKIHREEWARTGCSIMSDGWEDRCHRSILNFLVNCSKGSMFIESVDASSYSKTGDRLYMLLSRIIEKVGEHNVVQVITDNGSNFVAAGALLEAKYPHLYWTPCAAHCIDLMLEDISKISAIDRVLKRAIHMTSFIYQRPNLINLMRRFSGQRNLLRPAKTRFATAFITLSSIHKQRDNLRKLFTSQEWVTSKWAKELGGKRASQTVLMPTFWNGLVYALKLTGPLVHTLRLVDGERKPAMGYIYEAMDRTKEIIASTFNGNESKYIDVFQIIDNRWECQLHRPLHAAGHFLNPEFFYNNPQLEQCEEVVSGLYQCIQRLVPIIAKQDKIMEELTAYKNADGLFGNPMAIRHRKTKAPAEWWAAYGSSTPTLQQFAVKILSLTCSSSGCERNWSIFEHSVAFTAVPLFIVAGVWFLVFGLCLFIIAICQCCCKRERFGYSRLCYALSLIFLILFTIAAIIGCIVLYTGQERFHRSTTSTLDYVIDQADTTVWKLRNVSGYLAAAKQIGVHGVGLPSDVQTDIDDIVIKTNSSANVLEDKTTGNADDIHSVMDAVRLALIIVAAVMLFLTFSGFLLSLFGLQSFVYVLVLFGWFFVAGTFILCGIFLLLHNVTEDTCVSMTQWVQHPADHTALDDILPCIDNTTSQETLNRSKEVTSQIVDVINQVITNVSNINFASSFKPMYYNQSGPILPLLCNPFYKDLTDRPCSSGEVDLGNATQVWKNYVCEVSSSGICVTTGRLTPTYYDQMAAAVNVSYGLYNYGPFLVDLQDCTFVRQTFTDITRDHCPGLQRYSKWVYVGLAMVSGAVMLSLMFWVIYGRERRHRIYTKHVMEEGGDKTY